MKRSIRKTVSSGHKEGDSGKVDSSRGGGGCSGVTAIKAGWRQRPQNSAFRGWVRGKQGEEKGVILYKSGIWNRKRAGETAPKEWGFHAMVTAGFVLLSFSCPIDSSKQLTNADVPRNH